MRIRAIYKIEIMDKYYIGSSVNYNDRKWRHLRKLKLNKHSNRIMQNKYNVCGIEAVKFDILELVDEGVDILGREQEYLDIHFDNPKCMNVCRLATGGGTNPNPWQAHKHNLGSKRTEETKRLQSEAQKRIHKERPQDPKILEKMWAASAEYRKQKYPPFILIKDGIEYGPFLTQKEVYSAENKLMSNEGISELYNSKRTHVNGFHLKFVEIAK